MIVMYGPARAAGPRGLVLCDRDGTIVENRENYIRALDEVTFLPGTTSALRKLITGGYSLVLVTNQSLIGRGLVERDEVLAIHEHIVRRLTEAGATPALSLICPHTPTDRCGCRKPAPGMLRYALEACAAPADRSWMIGDSAEDYGAGTAAGVRTLHLLSGRGTAALAAARPGLVIDPRDVCRDLAEAVDRVLSSDTNPAQECPE